MKLNIGDVFSLILNDGYKGYERIMKMDKPLVFVELYRIKPTKDSYSLKELENNQPLLSIWSSSDGLKTGTWIVEGNITVPEDYEMPYFCMVSGFTGKTLLFKGKEKFGAPKDLIEVTDDKMAIAQPYGAHGEELVKEVYIVKLKVCGLLD